MWTTGHTQCHNQVDLSTTKLLLFSPKLTHTHECAHAWYTHKLCNTLISCAVHSQAVQRTHKLCSTLTSCAVCSQAVQYTHKLCSTLTSCAVHSQALQYTHKLFSTLTSCAVHSQAVQYTHKLCSTLTSCAVHSQAVQYTHKLCVFRSRIQIQDMYFAKPPVAPDLEFYREVFQTLIKFNDRYVSGHPEFRIVCTRVHMYMYVCIVDLIASLDQVCVRICLYV